MLNPLKRIKAAMKKWLNRLAQENKKQFGSGVPDCCKMNSQVPKASKPECGTKANGKTDCHF